MNVSLTPELTELVERKVRSGRYQSASEVVREGLRLLADQDQVRELQLEATREKIRVGLDQLDRGEGISSGKVLEEMRAMSAKARRRTGK